MSDQEESGDPAGREPPVPKGGGPEHQQVHLSGVTARVPPSVGHGVFSTGAIVMNGPNEMVIDFVQQIGQPGHVVARVVIPKTVAGQFISALEENLAKYEQTFGKAPELPRPDPARPRPSIEEIYENLKLPDERLSGCYANAVFIRHSAAEFSLDFVTTFYPHSAVASRVFLSAPHVRPVLESLKSNYQQSQQRPPRQGEVPRSGTQPPGGQG